MLTENMFFKLFKSNIENKIPTSLFSLYKLTQCFCNTFFFSKT